MAFILLIAFICVPIIEIAVFIEVGDQIGLWPTLGIVIVTAIAGTALLRRQGISVLFRIEETMRANKIPLQELFDGICLVIAGALLLTPGFVTDGVGFLLFVPPVRQAIAAWLGRKFLKTAQVRMHAQGNFRGQANTSAQGNPFGQAGGGFGPRPVNDPFAQRDDIIDGEFEDITDPKPNDNDPARQIDAPKKPDNGPSKPPEKQ